MSILGVFHVHSNFSHDGCDSLEVIAENLYRRGFRFCFITDHFEDFDENSFKLYISTIEKINKSKFFVFIPGMEIGYKDVHILLAPVNDFYKLKESIKNNSFNMFLLRVVAHPSKYSLESLLIALRDLNLNGIEIWNQKADGSFLPPLDVLNKFKDYEFSSSLFVRFFGLDLHNIKLPINNVIRLDINENCASINTIVFAILKQYYYNCNIRTNICLPASELSFSNIKTLYVFFGKIVKSVRAILIYLYLSIPKKRRKKLDKLKNNFLGYL